MSGNLLFEEFRGIGELSVPLILANLKISPSHMITLEKFLAIKDEGTVPEDIPSLLQALLLDAAGDWDSAHAIAQKDPSQEGSLVHAYLHRKEGDLGNASYWYHRAGTRMPAVSLPEEWEYIAMKLLEKS